MALKLPTLLEGEALTVWLELDQDMQGNYKEIKKKLMQKIRSMGFVSLEEFHQGKMHPGEALSMSVYDLKKLLGQLCHPQLELAARNQLLLHQPIVEATRCGIDKQVATLSTRKATGNQQIPIKRRFNCNQVGHLQRNGPNRQQPAWDTRQCFECSRCGHLAKYCPQGNDSGVFTCRASPRHQDECCDGGHH